MQATGEFSGYIGELTAVKFSPDGSRLATATTDDPIRIWNIHRQALHYSPAGVSTGGTGLAFSADGFLLAAALNDGTVRIWTSDGTVADELPSNLRSSISNTQVSITFSPIAPLLATIDEVGMLCLWDVVPMKLLESFAGSPHPAINPPWAPVERHLLTFSIDGEHLAVDCTSDHGKVQIWQVRSPRSKAQWVAEITGIIGPVTDLAYSPDGRTLAIVDGNLDRPCVELRDAHSLAPAGRLRTSADAPYKVAFSPTGQHLAAAAGDGTVWVWDVAHRRHVAHFPAHAEGWDAAAQLFPITCIDWSPDGKFLATGGWSLSDASYRTKHDRIKGQEVTGTIEFVVRLWEMREYT